MRKPLMLAGLFLLFACLAHAQYPPYYFGLKAAPQLSWFKPNVDNYSGNGIRTGFSWGFIAEMNFTENHSIASGFNMMFNGGKLSFPAAQGGDTGTMNRTYSLKYLEIPLTLKMRTGEMNGVRYFGRIGLGTAFRIGAKNTDEFVKEDGTTVSSPKSNYDKISFARESLIVGLGGEYEIKNGPKLGAELTFNNGFTNILTSRSTVQPSLQEKAVPNFFELAFSVLF
jgi:hypothetical protein